MAMRVLFMCLIRHTILRRLRRVPLKAYYWRIKMLYEITDGTVTSGGETILPHIHFEIRGTEKIGLVGPNGAGKTTLLRLIAGEIFPDRDDRRQGPAVVTSRRVPTGMLTQTQEKDKDHTIDELIMEACPADDIFSKEYDDYQAEYDRIFTGFGFRKEDKGKKLGEFSGGEQTKIAMIQLLLLKPDILLLDEPTNHLDLKAIEWLEEYMRQYSRAVVFVSHDRFFLDRTVDVIYDLQNGRLTRYAGNYTSFREQKRKKLAAARKAYESQQKDIERLDALIEKFKHKPRKAAFARSRKTILDRMEKLPKPGEEDVPVFTEEIDPLVKANKWPIEAEKLEIGYDKTLLRLSLKVRRGQKIGIIGDNGSGKTTFLRTLAGFTDPVSGECRLGERTTIGYFDQQTASLESEDLVVDHFHRLFPAMTEKEVRKILGRYLFTGSKAQTRVSALSGGEKARLVIAEILESRPNLLLLDEPTNHMDIQVKETLENAVRSYTGTVLFVSHDRYFISRVADAILVFEEGRAMYYPFGYEHYLERAKKKRGENLSALLRSEDQAMIEGLRSVPEKEKHRLKEYSTEELSRDWMIRLAKEELAEAEENYQEAALKELEFFQQEYLRWVVRSLEIQEYEQEGPDEKNIKRDLSVETAETLKAKREEAEKRLTEALISLDMK